TGADASSTATMPRLVANAQIAWPMTMPSAVNTPPRRPPTSVLRTVSAVSGPGVAMTKIEMLTKARKEVSMAGALSWLKDAFPGFADQVGAQKRDAVLAP